jgi:hypothetical protein
MTALLIQRGAQFEQKTFAPADPYEAMAAHFIDCVLGKTELCFPPTESRGTLQVIDQLRVACTKFFTASKATQ